MRLVNRGSSGRLALGLSVGVAVLAVTAIVLSLFAVDQLHCSPRSSLVYRCRGRVRARTAH